MLLRKRRRSSLGYWRKKASEMQKKLKLLVVQRISLSHDSLMSRSIAARFGPMLKFMDRHDMIEWEQIVESEITVKHLRQFDVVLFNKHSSNRALTIMRMANDLGLKTVYDLDDWIIDLPMYSVTDLNDDLLENITRLIREASVVTVSNEVLQRKLQHIRPSVSVVSNGFDHEAIPSQPWQEASPPKILFSNTDGIKLVKFKEQFFHVLGEFSRRHPEVSIDFWGDYFHGMESIPKLVPKGFLENSQYKQAIRDAGYLFAIVPLGGKEDADTLFFNSCKSCIKYIDYGSLGIPGIYSRSPVYEEAVSHLKTGYLVENNAEEWGRGMEEMFADKKLRDRMRHEAYDDAVSRFSIDRSSEKLLTLFN
jgi:glycosyltransferase involved in cell wall biosynthesis